MIGIFALSGSPVLPSITAQPQSLVVNVTPKRRLQRDGDGHGALELPVAQGRRGRHWGHQCLFDVETTCRPTRPATTPWSSRMPTAA